MDERAVIKLISQFLHERGFEQSLKSLEAESGRVFLPDAADLKTGKLLSILDEFTLREKHHLLAASSVEHCFGPGNGECVGRLWCSFDGLCDGVNLLVVQLTMNGVLLFGGAKSQLGISTLPLPLMDEAPPITPIPTVHTIGKAGILCIDIHPKNRNLLLCGSMDRCAYTLNTEEDRADVMQRFSDHTKYVVQALWIPSGGFFVTGSYDHSICVYRLCSEEERECYELVEKLEVNGAVEGLAVAKETDHFLVGIRNSHLLHHYDLSSGRPTLSRTINLNMFGDDFISFVPMHISFSPDGRYFLVSTDKDRLVLYSWETGKQITNFYGASSDDFSQPRHSWDASGKYIYGTSQDFSICVWEVRSQRLVHRLTGHTATVRNLHFCEELGILVSCGFDGTIKLWKRTP